MAMYKYNCPYGTNCTLLFDPQHLAQANHAAHPIYPISTGSTYLNPPHHQAPPIQPPHILQQPYRPSNARSQPACRGLLHTDPWCAQGVSCTLLEDETHQTYFWHPCKHGKDCNKLTDALHNGYFHHFTNPFEDLVRARHCLQGQNTTLSLLSASKEYQWVTAFINAKGGLNGQQIESIVRVNNEHLFELFFGQVSTLQKNVLTLKTLDNTHTQVKWLFHSPALPAHVDQIATHNLSFQFGSALGDGIYFTAATTSPLFRPVNGTNTAAQSKHFVLSLVLVGSNAVGSAGLRRPPSGCHSTVDNVANPSTYVSFSKDHVYPAYIIKVK